MCYTRYSLRHDDIIIGNFSITRITVVISLFSFVVSRETKKHLKRNFIQLLIHIPFHPPNVCSFLLGIAFYTLMHLTTYFIAIH